MNKITSISATISKDYSDKTLKNIWIATRANSDRLPEQSQRLNEQIQHIIQSANQVICVFSGSLNNEILHTGLLLAAQNGKRVYIYTNTKTKDHIKDYAGKLLIRLSDRKIPGSFILTDANTTKASGLFFSNTLDADALDKESGLFLNLDKTQTDDLYLFFTDCFWNKAKFEIKNPNEWAKPAEVTTSPYETIPVQNKYLRSEYFINTIENQIINKTDVLICFDNLRKNSCLYLEPEKLANVQVHTSFRGNDADYLYQVAKHNSRISASESPVQFQTMMNSESGFVIPDLNPGKDDLLYLLKFNSTQYDKVRSMLHSSMDNASYRYFHELKYKDLRTEFYQANGLNKSLKIAEQDKEEQPYSNIELIKIQNPNFENYLKENEHYALKTDYRITLNPFKLPKAAIPDKLYEKWNKVHERYSKKIAELKSGISSLENKQSDVKEDIMNYFKSLFTGKNIAFKQLLTKLDELNNVNLLTMECGEAKSKFEELNRFVDELNHTSMEYLGEFEKQKQRADYDRKMNAIKSEIEKLKQQKADKENELSKLLTKLNDETEEKAIAGLKRESEKLKNVISNLNGQIEQKEKFLKPFTPEATLQNETKISLRGVIKKDKLQSVTGIRFVEIERLNLAEIPAESLPVAGKLFQNGDKRYLSIEFWEEFENAQIESVRLKAELCCIE